MESPDIKAQAENWISDVIESMEIAIAKDEQPYFNNYSPMQNVMRVIAHFESDGFDMSHLFNEGFTPEQASSTMIEYYEDYWDNEKSDYEYDNQH